MRFVVVVSCAVLWSASIAAQTSTNTTCRVNGQYVQCSSKPSVMVMPAEPSRTEAFLAMLNQWSADQAAANAKRERQQQKAADESAAKRTRAAIILAGQFAQLPLDVRLANYDRLPVEVKAYVLDPRLTMPPAQAAANTSMNASKDPMAPAAVETQESPVGSRALDDPLCVHNGFGSDTGVVCAPHDPASINVNRTRPVCVTGGDGDATCWPQGWIALHASGARASASDPRCVATASGGVTCPPRQPPTPAASSAARPVCAVSSTTEGCAPRAPITVRKVSVSRDTISPADNSPCTSIGDVWAECESCDGDPATVVKKLQSAVWDEARRRGATHVKWHEPEGRRLSADAFVCR